MINIIIADDHQIVLDGLKSLLIKEKDICCIAQATNGVELLNLLENHQIDIAVIDINMPRLNGIETTKKIKERYPNVKVLILSMHNDNEYINQAIEIGASGYILKNKGKEELVRAIQKIASGNDFFGEEIHKTLIIGLRKKPNSQQNPEKIKLTKRENDVIKLIGKAYSTPMISEELNIARSTVETHRRNLIDKLGVANSKELIGYAIENGYTKLS